YENTGSELVALLLESDEIKRLKPRFNSAQKRTRAIPHYGIYKGMDASGYITLFIDRLKMGVEPLTTADSALEVRETFYRAIEKHHLCLTKCGLHNLGGPCFDYHLHKCFGACINEEDPETYNRRVMQAISDFSFENESFFIIGDGRKKEE